MTWGTDFNSDIFIARKQYNNIGEIIDEINIVSDDIKSCEEKLKMYAICTPKDVIVDTEIDDVIGWFSGMLDELLQDYREQITLLHNLELLKESAEEGKYKFREVE